MGTVTGIGANWVARAKAKARRAPAPLEAQDQAALIDHLERRAHPGVWWCAVPNGGSRNVIEAARLKGQGVVAGAPDLVVCIDGRMIGLEMKRAKGGRLSEAQLLQKERIERAGGLWFVAHGLDEALSILSSLNAFKCASPSRCNND